MADRLSYHDFTRFSSTNLRLPFRPSNPPSTRGPARPGYASPGRCPPSGG